MISFEAAVPEVVALPDGVAKPAFSDISCASPAVTADVQKKLSVSSWQLELKPAGCENARLDAACTKAAEHCR